MIGIVVVIYKSIDETIRFINQEIPKIKVPFKLAIVNNCGTNEDSIFLVQKCNATLVDSNKIDISNNQYVITIKENIGYANGNNVGVEFLTKHFELEYILFSNNDIVIPSQKNSLEVLLKKMDETNDIGIIGPQILGLDNKSQSPHFEISFYRYFGWIAFPFLRNRINLFKIKESKKNELEKSGYCYWVSGCFFLVRTLDFINAGMFDTNTFLYGEEKILSERMLNINKMCYYVSTFTIIHKQGLSTTNYLRKKEIDRLVFESDCYFFEKYKYIHIIFIKVLRRIFYTLNK